MPSKQILHHEVTYHPETVEDRSTASNERFFVYLPDTIARIDLQMGDCVGLEKTTDDVPYIAGRKIPKDPPCKPDYKIHQADKPRVTVPADWIDDFIQFGGEETLIVEVNTVDDEFRIYRNQDYNSERIPELNEMDEISVVTGQPVVVPASAALFARDDEAAPSRDADELRAGFGDDIDDEGRQ